MSPAFRKLLLVLGGLAIAAAVTYYPWTYLDHFTGAASSVYGMSSVIWAPAALIIGLVAGFGFAFLFWPRASRPTKPPAAPARDDDGVSSIEA